MQTQIATAAELPQKGAVVRNRARLWTALAALLLALAVAACGGGEGEGEEPSPTPGAAPSATGTGAPADQPSGTPTDATTDGTTGGTTGGTTEGAAGGAGTYVVESGDTLSSIATELGTTVEALVEANGIPDPDVLDVGQELVIP